jgi:hypothetical protein
MKRIEKGIISMLCMVLALCVWNCSDDKPDPTPPTPPEPAITVNLSADKTTIKANGADSVAFAVTDGDGAALAGAVIVCTVEADKTDTISGLKFSTREAGTYAFHAVYKGTKSGEISIDAAAITVVLKADKATVKANGRDAVQFTILADGSDVTASAVVTMEAEGAPTTVLDGLAFATREPSVYTFYATFDGSKSDTVRIEALPVIYLLTVDKPSIAADARDAATFRVTVDDVDVSYLAAIVQTSVDTGEETTLRLPSFATDEYGQYRFQALYDGEKTNEIVVDATYAGLAFQMQYMVMDFTSTTCPNCTRMASIIDEVEAGMPGRLYRVAAHMGGLFCTSDLSGAMGQIANGLSNDTYFPSATVELRYEEYQSATNTAIRLRAAINKATLARGSASETGIAIESNVNGADIEMTVKVKSVRTDNYRFFAFIVEDGIPYNQLITSDGGYETVVNYVHKDVMTYPLSADDPRQGLDFGRVTKGKSTVRTFTVHTDGFNTKRTVNLSKCRIIAYTLRANGIIDNVVNCPVNGSIPYRYAE